MRDAGTDVSAVEITPGKIRLVLGNRHDEGNEGPEDILDLLK
jgi:hypothetical protein